MSHGASRSFLVTSVPAAVLILGLFTSGLHAQLSLPAEFNGMLGQRGMMLDSGLLAGYELVPVIPNDDMEYNVALRSASGRLEVRYAFRWDPGENSFSAFALTTLLNVGTGQDALGPFPPQAVRAEFNADRGVSGPFAPRSTFSSKYDSGIMVAIWAEGRGIAYTFYLFNENQRELALAEWRSVFYALRFRP